MEISKTSTDSLSKLRERLGFKEVVGNTGTILYVLDKKADHQTSMALLKEARLGRLEYRTALSLLAKDDKLKTTLKGKMFGVAGEVIDEKLKNVVKGEFTATEVKPDELKSVLKEGEVVTVGYAIADSKDGLATIVEEDELHKFVEYRERMVYVSVWSGMPLYLTVYDGDMFSLNHRRFDLNSNLSNASPLAGPAIVGIAEPEKELVGVSFAQKRGVYDDSAPGRILNLYGAGKIKEAAEAFLQYYEDHSASSTNLATKANSREIVMVLGFELTKNPQTYERLEAVLPKMITIERISTVMLIPTLAEKGLSEEQKVFYKNLLSTMCSVFGTENLSEIAIIIKDSTIKFGLTSGGVELRK